MKSRKKFFVGLIFLLFTCISCDKDEDTIDLSFISDKTLLDVNPFEMGTSNLSTDTVFIKFSQVDTVRFIRHYYTQTEPVKLMKRDTCMRKYKIEGNKIEFGYFEEQLSQVLVMNTNLLYASAWKVRTVQDQQMEIDLFTDQFIGNTFLLIQ